MAKELYNGEANKRLVRFHIPINGFGESGRKSDIIVWKLWIHRYARVSCLMVYDWDRCDIMAGNLRKKKIQKENALYNNDVLRGRRIRKGMLVLRAEILDTPKEITEKSVHPIVIVELIERMSLCPLFSRDTCQRHIPE